jgi:hypothetical protein
MGVSTHSIEVNASLKAVYNKGLNLKNFHPAWTA